MAWVDRPTTNSRKIVARVAAPLSVAIEMNMQMQKAIAQVTGELRDAGESVIGESYE